MAKNSKVIVGNKLGLLEGVRFSVSLFRFRYLDLIDPSSLPRRSTQIPSTLSLLESCTCRLEERSDACFVSNRTRTLRYAIFLLDPPFFFSS